MKKNVFRTMMLLFAILFLYKGNAQESQVETYLSHLDINSPINTLTEKEKQHGWDLLFNGKDLKGWHGYNEQDAPDCWRVKEGALEILTEGGREGALGIITDKKYKSFVLSIEFKLTQGANSGIIFQVEENDKYTYPYETGAEFQVIDHDNWPNNLEDWQICGANYAMYPPKVKPYKPIGEWNQVLLIVNHNKVTQLLNGKVVVEYEKYSDEWKQLRNSGKWGDFPDYGKFNEGHIALQNHGTNVFYRNIKLKEL
jgi:hypothetical protein